MSNSEFVQNVVEENNDILKKQNVEACDVPESLVAYAIVENSPDIIYDFLVEGFLIVSTGDGVGFKKTALVLPGSNLERS